MALSPREWLEQQRRAHGYDEKPVPPELIAKAVSGIPPPEAKQLIELYSGLTIGQLNDRQIQLFLQPLLPLLTQAEREIVAPIYFGVFPTFSVDAYGTSLPGGHKIVMVHAGLPFVVNSWANLFLFTLEHGSWDWLDSRSDELIDFFARVGAVWNHDISVFSEGPLALIPKERDSWMLSSVLTHSAMAFILGHEMGHILEGHEGYWPGNSEYNHSMEYAADIWGLRIALRHTVINGSRCPDTYFPKFMLVGPFLALSMIATIDDVQGTTHPSASARLAKIEVNYLPLLLELLGEEGLQRYQEEMDQDFLERTISIGTRLFERHRHFADLISEIGAFQAAAMPMLGDL
jgi:hypothetical protein